MGDMNKYNEDMQAAAEQNTAALASTPGLTAEQEQEARLRIQQAGADFNDAQNNPAVMKVALMTSGSPQAMVDMLASLRITTGLPRDLQEQVMKQIEVNDAKARTSEADYEKALAAAASGAAFLAAWAASTNALAEASASSSAERSNSSGGRVDFSKSIDDMNPGERAAYWQELSTMGEAQWNNLTPQQQQQAFTNGGQAGEQHSQQGQLKSEDWLRQVDAAVASGDLTPEQAATLKQMGSEIDIARVSGNKTGADGKPLVEVDKKAAEALKAEYEALPEPQRTWMLRRLEIETQAQAGNVAASTAAGSPSHAGANNIGTANAVADQAQAQNEQYRNATAQARQDAAAENDRFLERAMEVRGEVLRGPNGQNLNYLAMKSPAIDPQTGEALKPVFDVEGKVLAAQNEGIAARVTADAASVSKTELAAKDNSGQSLDDEPVQPVVTARPPSIDIPTVTQGGKTGPVVSPDSPLLAQLGAAEPVNASSALVAEGPKQRPTTPGQGMGTG